MKFSLLTTFALILTLTSTSTQADVTKAAEIEALLNETMTASLMDSMMSQLLLSMPTGKLTPTQSKHIQDVFQKEARQTLPSLISKVAPTYDRNFSQAEIEEILKFYQSAIGKKFIHIQPLLVQEMGPAARAWGEDVMRRVLATLKAEMPKNSNSN